MRNDYRAAFKAYESCGHEFSFKAVVRFSQAMFSSKDLGMELTENWIMVLPRD